MDTTKATAQRICSAVEAAGLTRRDLSDASGVAYTTLYRKLNGHTPFNVEEIHSIALVLGVPAASLVDFGVAA